MTIDDFTPGQAYDINTASFRCSGCGKAASNVRYKAMATDRVEFREGEMRRYFVFHNPVCHCAEGIWLGGVFDVKYVPEGKP